MSGDFKYTRSATNSPRLVYILYATGYIRNSMANDSLQQQSMLSRGPEMEGDQRQGARRPLIRRIPAPEAPVPAVAWPTVGVLAGGIAAWCGSSALAVAGLWPWPLSVAINAAAAFALFTVTHEACHRTLSTSAGVNAWL